MSASASLVCVPPERVAAIWPFVSERLHGAVRKTDLAHSADIDADTLRGGGQLWLAFLGDTITAAATTILIRTDRNLVCVMSAIGGGNMQSWLPLLSGVEAWAKAEGATKFRIFGRKGWTRVLADYSVTHVVLERQL